MIRELEKVLGVLALILAPLFGHPYAPQEHLEPGTPNIAENAEASTIPGDGIVHIPNGAAVDVLEVDGEIFQSCSLTIVSQHKALTAGHCGLVGQLITYNGEFIGEITSNLLVEGEGVDIAVVKFNQIATGISEPWRAGYEPQVGDQISMRSESSGERVGVFKNAVSIERKVRTPVGRFPAKVWPVEMRAARGDSGAPIFHDGYVVGMVQGGNLEDISVLTLPSEM